MANDLSTLENLDTKINEDYFALKQVLGRTWSAEEQRHIYKVQWDDLSTGELTNL